MFTSVSWMHRLPRTYRAQREAFICRLCEGKRVVHIGFWDTDGHREVVRGDGRWLHDRLHEVASELVGIDYDHEGVRQAEMEGYDVHFADCADPIALANLQIKPADIVIAGEIIEHVEKPGDFLDGLHHLAAPDGLLVLTTPNAHALFKLLIIMTGHELVNPDHVAIYSWYTLTNMLARHGWRPLWFNTYNPKGARTPSGKVLLQLQRWTAKPFPWISAGFIVGCESVSKR